jgi:AraC-like DNA-binding protein
MKAHAPNPDLEAAPAMGSRNETPGAAPESILFGPPLAEQLAAAGHRADTVAAYQAAIERVIACMKARLAEPLDLDQLARVASMSKFHLVRVFDELTGTTPHHFLACLRVQRAKELLLAPDASITDVCVEVGYASLGTFSKTFNSLVGVSPQQFRAMPKRLTVKQFATAIWHYLASDRKVSGPRLDGVVENPSGLRGFVFVGAFTEGVPQGAPFSGTVMVKPGAFRIERPAMPEFHLLAVLVPFSANLSAMVASLPVGLVASLRVRNSACESMEKPRLILRQLRATDPPILLALPALPPWRETLAK